MLRYFFYISGALVAVVLPLFLIVFAALIIQRSILGKESKWWRQGISLVMTSTLLLLVFYTAWAFIGRDNQAIAHVISIYIYMALYLIAMFVSYMILSFIIKYSPTSKYYAIIMVLGAKIEEEGALSFSLQSRLDKAVAVYKQQVTEDQAVKILVTGGNLQAEGPSEAEEMGQYLIEKDIPVEDILFESKARNTDENFYFAQPIVKQQQAGRQVLVITNTFHLIRAHYFAWLNGMKVDLQGAHSSLFSWPYSVVREYLAFLLVTKEINYACLVFLTLHGLSQAFNIY